MTEMNEMNEMTRKKDSFILLNQTQTQY